MNIHTDGAFAAASTSTLPPPHHHGVTAPWRQTGRLRHFHGGSPPKHERTPPWLLLVSVSLAAAAADSMADGVQLPGRDRALRGREDKMVAAGK